MAGDQRQGTLDTRGCPDDEMLAAYLDGKLSKADVTRLETHMAGCDQCVELLAAIAPGLEMVQHPAPVEVRGPDVVPFPVPAPVVDVESARPRRLTRWLAPIAASLIVVIGGAFVVRFVSDAGPGLEVLRSATQEQRRTQGRLTQFAYAPPIPTRRSSTAVDTPPPQALLDAAAAVEQARSGRTDAASLHAYGVALLISGEVDAAIDTLLRAVTLSPRDAAVLADASTAWLQKGQATSDAKAFGEARRLAEEAVAIAPQSVAAWFNLGLIGRLHGDPALTARALAQLQALEAGSPWIRELEEP